MIELENGVLKVNGAEVSTEKYKALIADGMKMNIKVNEKETVK